MATQLNELLRDASERSVLPGVIAYNRIDGPGSSLDLREFQQALWSIPFIPININIDPSMAWTRLLPRTIGITIDTGTKVEARPFDPDLIGVESVEYGFRVTAMAGKVVPTKKNWLLKIIDLFNIRGVMFHLQNLKAGTISAGLGGSATATMGVCILANELAGRPFGPTQLVTIASRIEQDFGVSITGTQEQSNVIFGGVTDYIWFPWGMPGEPESGYGYSLRTELIPPEDYGELEQRMAIFHAGFCRASTDVNAVWMEKLSTDDGFTLHHKKLEISYQFREGLRLRDWGLVLNSIRKYRQIRFDLCSDYMAGADEIFGRAENIGKGTAFPLGAGGGGGILVFTPDPKKLEELRKDLFLYKEIAFKIKPKGHELINLPI